MSRASSVLVIHQACCLTSQLRTSFCCMFARYITLLRVHSVPSKAEPVAQGTLVIITLSSEYMKYFQCPQTLGSGHWFFSAFKIPLEVIPKSQPSRATISKPSFFNSGTSDSQIIVSGTFFCHEDLLGCYGPSVFSQPD